MKSQQSPLNFVVKTPPHSFVYLSSPPTKRLLQWKSVDLLPYLLLSNLHQTFCMRAQNKLEPNVIEAVNLKILYCGFPWALTNLRLVHALMYHGVQRETFAFRCHIRLNGTCKKIRDSACSMNQEGNKTIKQAIRAIRMFR